MCMVYAVCVVCMVVVVVVAGDGVGSVVGYYGNLGHWHCNFGLLGH